MSSAKRVIKNTLFLYLRMVVSILVNIFITRILLQALGVSDYGLYNVVAGALSMLSFLSASMSSATQRFISYAEGEGKMEKIRTIFNSAILLHRIIALIVCLLFIAAGFILFNGVLNIPSGRMTTAILVYGCLILSTVFSIVVVPFEGVLNAHENMLLYSLLGILDVFLKLFIAIGVSVSSSDRLLLYGILMASEAWAIRLLTQLYCRQHYEECRDVHPLKFYHKQTVREMASFAGWNTLNISSGMFSLYGMNIVINHFFGTLLNAAMGIANQLNGVLMGVSSNMTKALTPILVKKEGAKDRNEVLEISYIGCKYSFLLFSFFCIPFLFCMPFILELWLKEVPEWTVLFCRLMIISSMIEQLFVFLFQSIMAEGRIKTYNLYRSVFNIMPLVVGIVQYSYGLNPSWIIIDWIIFWVIIGGMINLHFSRKNLGLEIRRWIHEVFLPCLLITATVSLLCFLVLSKSFDSLFLQIVQLLCIFILSLPLYWYLSIKQSERQMIKNYFVNRE